MPAYGRSSAPWRWTGSTAGSSTGVSWWTTRERSARAYDKIHLFDVDLSRDEQYRESDVVSPGETAVVADTPWGGLGMTTCYDLRFPQLYRTLAKAGAEILAVPAAFTKTTGQAHWHVLNRAPGH